MANTTCNGIRYIIRQGDTLYKISRTYRVPLALILRANPYADVYNLQVGDEICIPLVPQFIAPPAPGAPNPFENMMIYVIQAGDTLESILNRFGLTMEDFLKYNAPRSMMLQPGSTIEVPEANMEMRDRPNMEMRSQQEIREKRRPPVPADEEEYEEEAFAEEPETETEE